ncbi:hypothetical protein A20C1_03226 [marine actinobacterium PHSC20C1]|nr:hypothetical protein A20C1_03226 [marine actinobacterium PHSC20C1]
MTTVIQGNAHDTTGRFATQNRDEAAVGLAATKEPETCRICGTTDIDDGDDPCDAYISLGHEKCRECRSIFNDDGDVERIMRVNRRGFCSV